MKRISAGSIFFAKYLFPVLWFGFLGFFVFTVLSNRDAQGGLSLFAIIVPVLMGIFGYFMLKKMVWDLADEVLDAGDSLVVRFGKEQERISLANIINLSYSYMMSPARVTLLLRQPCRFGNEVSFAAQRPRQEFLRIAFDLSARRRCGRTF